MLKPKCWRFILIFVILIMATLACGTGYSTTRTHVGDQGQVVVNINSVEDSDQRDIEIYEDYSWDTVTLNITVEVESGSYKATFVDNEGLTLTLDASGGHPASASTQMTTDAFGSITLQSEGSGAQNVKITIDYTIP